MKLRLKIDAETREKILALLQNQTNAQIELTEEVKEELIGGFIFSNEDKQYDASILRRDQESSERI